MHNPFAFSPMLTQHKAHQKHSTAFGQMRAAMAQCPTPFAPVVLFGGRSALDILTDAVEGTYPAYPSSLAVEDMNVLLERAQTSANSVDKMRQVKRAFGALAVHFAGIIAAPTSSAEDVEEATPIARAYSLLTTHIDECIAHVGDAVGASIPHHLH